MDIYRKRLIWKILLVLFAVIIGFGSLFYTRDLVDKLKVEERKKATMWAEATRRLVGATGATEDFEFLFSIVEGNTTVPIILTDDKQNIISFRNLGRAASGDTAVLRKELERMSFRDDPIVIDLGNGVENYIFFRESSLLRQLTVFPFVQLAVILLFIAVAYIAFSSSREAEQNQVWVGLSRETAHQLGTPTSSLSAWVEILKSRYPETDIAEELSADVERLGRVAERFSLIGSRTKLQPVDMVGLIENSLGYLRKRISSTVNMNLVNGLAEGSTLPANAVLLGWVIENLVKNATDAMKGRGDIVISLSESGKEMFLDVEDNGKGIPKKDFKTIFKPGYSTRERGWGLGLSLSKRIIEEYHRGKIFVRWSEPGKGTIMRVSLKKL